MLPLLEMALEYDCWGLPAALRTVLYAILFQDRWILLRSSRPAVAKSHCVKYIPTFVFNIDGKLWFSYYAYKCRQLTSHGIACFWSRARGIFSSRGKMLPVSTLLEAFISKFIVARQELSHILGSSAYVLVRLSIECYTSSYVTTLRRGCT